MSSAALLQTSLMSYFMIDVPYQCLFSVLCSLVSTLVSYSNINLYVVQVSVYLTNINFLTYTCVEFGQTVIVQSLLNHNCISIDFIFPPQRSPSTTTPPRPHTPQTPQIPPNQPPQMTAGPPVGIPHMVLTQQSFAIQPQPPRFPKRGEETGILHSDGMLHLVNHIRSTCTFCLSYLLICVKSLHLIFMLVQCLWVAIRGQNTPHHFKWQLLLASQSWLLLPWAPRLSP